MNIAHYLELQGMKKGRLEGLMESMRKGMLKGMDKGRLEGKKEDRRQATRSIAMHLLAGAVDRTLIKNCTGLTKKELQHLHAEYFMKLV
ncbi:MAG: hypothetical protein ACR5LG_00425 [Sodalis sp. (in: enterobacteria)]|uniref:hypothetical protein n=1 Tax=Sodalis sp. (in: enterobacteria) TaxID=1898979 RepID=UPI003F3FE31D